MKLYNKITPEGTGDILFDQCKALEMIKKSLTSLFYSRGYHQIITPVLEFYDVFNNKYILQENMRKLVDNKGRMLVMRPDCTIPIARLVATRLQAMATPIRLFYSENIFPINPDLKGKSNEIFQAGVELIGAAGVRSDLEIIELATTSLEEIGNLDYHIEICHIGYFKAIIDSLDVDDDTKEAIRTIIEKKNYAELSDILEPFGDSKATIALKYLPRLFGKEEIFDKAAELFSDNHALEVLDYLKNLYMSLKKLGIGDRIMVDLGLVNHADYYTGVIFRGYIENMGEPALAGGRYDNLISDFGSPLAATGFGININAIANTSAFQKIVVKPSDVVVFSELPFLTEAIDYIKKLTKEGLIVENSTVGQLNHVLDYAKSKGIPEIHIVGETIEIIKLAEVKV